MSKMYELKEIYSNIEKAWAQQEKAVLVILTDVKGSAYRLPGSKMLMTSSGKMVGTISGGCLEADLYAWAEKVFESNQPFVHQYDLSDTEIWSLGIGCKGDLQFLFLPVLKEDPSWRTIQQLIQEEKEFSMVINMKTGGKAILAEQFFENQEIPEAVLQEARQLAKHQTRAKVFTYEKIPYLIDAIKSSERVVVAGAGHDAILVAELAHQAGFRVTVIDSRTHFNNDKRFPNAIHITKEFDEISRREFSDSWWVIMNHHQLKDEEALRLAIESKPKYIGVLGPRYRTAEILEHIGYDFASGPIYSPVGLDLGAETMYEVAVSIVSEMMSLRAGRTAQSLHGREKIHV